MTQTYYIVRTKNEKEPRYLRVIGQSLGFKTTLSKEYSYAEIYQDIEDAKEEIEWYLKGLTKKNKLEFEIVKISRQDVEVETISYDSLQAEERKS